MTAYMISKVTELSANNSFYRLQGISGSAGPAQVTNIDWQFPEERWLTGGMCAVKGGHWGDTITVQLVVKDGQGNVTVINEMIKDLYVMDDTQRQGEVEVTYVSLIPQGVYIRLVYTNTHATDTAQVAMNMYTHKPADIP